jgi:DNA-binding response OmpR family regulator
MTPVQLPSSNLRTVLIIEDDQDTRQFVEDFLTMMGYTVLGAASGQAGLVAAASQPVDVILLDRRLPDADGIDLCRRLREGQASRVPIIFLTADRSPRLEAQARAAGATDFLYKPFLPTDLLQRLSQLA